MNRILVTAGALALIAGTAVAGDEMEMPVEPTKWDVPGDFATIQDAVDAAAEGDIICLIGNGPFAPFTVSTNNLTILGNDLRQAPADPSGCDFKVDKKADQDNTIPTCEDLPSIDGGGEAGTLIDATGVTIVGVCFTNGKDSHGNGGALKLANDASASLSYVSFEGNKADEDGGAIFVGRNASLSVNNANFSGNEAEFGGAIQAGQGSTLSIVDANFSGNAATGSGGAIDLLAAAGVSMEAVCFEGNEAETTVAGFGGAISNFLSPVTIKNAVFCGNAAIRGGGAIYNEDGTFDIYYSTFWNNTSLSGGGIEQVASPSAGSDPSALIDIVNSVIITTQVVNNDTTMEGSLLRVGYSFLDGALADGVIGAGCNIFAGSLPIDASTGEQITVADLFVDAENCDFRINYSPCWINPLIDSADSRECEDLCFDKADLGRAIDVVDNPSTGLVDEGVENTGVDIWRRNHTCDAADRGAYEYKQDAFGVIAASCSGDANFDGVVDIDDIFEVLRKFGYPCVVSDGCLDNETGSGATGLR